MRVIGGIARGHTLIAPKGREVRPTLDRVREALFNILGERVVDCAFLDLFSGTGAVGIEALSRGAASAVFVDSHQDCRSIIERNLAKTKLQEAAKVRGTKLPGGLKGLGSEGKRYDIIFADPPYKFEGHVDLLQSISSLNLLSENGLVIIEHDKLTEISPDEGDLTRLRVRKYGGTALSFFGHES